MTKQNDFPKLSQYRSLIMDEALPEHLVTTPPSIQQKLKKLKPSLKQPKDINDDIQP